jgi:hypothetical protein
MAVEAELKLRVGSQQTEQLKPFLDALKDISLSLKHIVASLDKQELANLTITREESKQP